MLPVKPRQQLEYAKAQSPFYRRRAFRRGLLGLLLAGVVATLVSTAVSSIIKGLEIARVERNCLAYAGDPSQVVLNKGPYISGAEGHYISAVRRLRAVNSFPALHGAATAFVHERFTPGGGRRLVVVFLGMPSPPDGGRPVADWPVITCVYAPGGMGGPHPLSERRGNTALDQFVQGGGDESSYRVFMGQPDPVDPTHFSIAFEVNGWRHTLHGWLENDNGVRYEVRDEASTQPTVAQ